MPHLAPDRLFLDFQAAVAGRYSLERELGRGGMGVVYLAREVRLDRPVAIKLLPPDHAGDAHLRERFLREARTAAKLSHPHIIPIFAVDEVGTFVFFAMAYVAGETLTERVRRRGPLPPSEAGRVLREVAWALAYAHSQGLVHRDVKPDNIMLEEASARTRAATCTRSVWSDTSSSPERCRSRLARPAKCWRNRSPSRRPSSRASPLGCRGASRTRSIAVSRRIPSTDLKRGRSWPTSWGLHSRSGA